MATPVPARAVRIARRFILLHALAVTSGLLAESQQPRGKAEHVVLVLWDGMRPEFVTEANAPALWKLAQSGVTFRNHHSVYPSLTNVNSTALATGMFPARTGLLANYEYRPELERLKFIRTDHPDIVRKADELARGHYLAAPTVAELVQAAGGRTAIAGGKTAALLHDRHASADSREARRFGDNIFWRNVTSFRLEPITKFFGTFPDKDRTPGTAGDNWTTKVLTEFLWEKDVPRYSVLWLSEPDRAEHASSPGSEAALEGNQNIGRESGTRARDLGEKRVCAIRPISSSLRITASRPFNGRSTCGS